jgi:hypothetical protein
MRKERRMEDLIPWIVFGVPLLLAVGIAAYFLMKPSIEIKRLEARAAAGDPSAQAALARMEELKGAMHRAIGGDDASRRRLLAEGKPARATIVDVKPVGLQVEVGAVPTRLVEVDLSITDEGRTWQVKVRDPVSEMHMGRLLKGSTVPIRFDPANPERVAVLWDTL